MYKMAFSKSIIKAQDIVLCNLCESETKLNWKCIDCDLLMCNNCRDKIHPKFKNAIDHTIVNIKTVGPNGGDRTLDFTNIKCKVHTKQTCCLYCSTCDYLVCPICIAQNHAGHIFMEVKDAYELKLEKLKSRKIEVEKAEKQLADDERKLDQMKISDNSKGKKILQDIQAQKDAFNNYANQLSKNILQNIKDSEDCIAREQKKILDSRQKVQEELNSFADLFNPIDPLRFLEHADVVPNLSEISTQPINLSHCYIPKFIPRKIVSSTVGSLIKLSISDGTDQFKMKVSRQFVTGLQRCRHISFVSDDCLWIGDDKNQILQKIKPHGDNITTITTLNTPIRGIAVIPCGDLLLADSTPRLKLISGTSGKIKDSKYSVDPLLIKSVHVSRGHKIVIGAMSSGEVIPVTGRRVVIVMDQDGNHEIVFEHDKDKHRLLTYPKSITSTFNGNIFVSDYSKSDKYNSRILALDKDGRTIKTYNGHPDFNNKNRPFQPVFIESTLLDNIITLDLKCHAFHILDSSCNLLAYLNTSDMGMWYPACIALTNATTLYLGCRSTDDNSTKAKLSEIEYSGF